MIKTYYEYLTEALIEREGEIKFDFTGGGLKPPTISFDALRNPDSTGSVVMELYSKGGTTYKFTADEELVTQMSIINDLADSTEESKQSAMKNIEKIIEDRQDTLNADLLQIFSQFDEQVKEVLKKNNITRRIQKTFESLGGDTKKEPVNSVVYISEPQGKLRRSASVKVWDKIGVGKSSVDAAGVFCVDYIKNGECFEVAPLLVIPKDQITGTVVMDYVFKLDDSLYAIAFGNASLYNHRNQPMADWKINTEKKTISFYALRDIEPGEEIFISYGKSYWKSRDISMETSPVQKTINKIKQ